MNTITKTFAFALVAATGFAGAVSAQDAVQEVTTIETVATKTTIVEPPAMVATHTVKTIMESPKGGADVTLIGTIGAKIGSNTYAFTDRTGIIQVEISDKLMPAGIPFGQTVRIDGKINNTGFVHRITEVDVKRISVV